MLLIVTATEMEMRPIRQVLAGVAGWMPLVAGVGLLETAVRLSRFLAERPGEIGLVVNCGVAGAYVGAGPGLLDVCLAERETLADFGVWLADGVERLDTVETESSFFLTGPLVERAEALLAQHGLTVWRGPFVSVQAVSGLERRGERLRSLHGAICENMEGAAVARVAAEFGLPCLELRAVSNLVRDRDPVGWRLAEAAAACATAVAVVLPGLLEG